MSPLRFYFLGSPHIERADGSDVALSSAKAVALLAYLAATQVPQSRERLLTLLWPDSLDSSARKNLRNILWTIRRSLGDDVLEASPDRLALGESIWVDTLEFEKIANSRGGPSVEDEQATLDLYHGPFLDDLSLADAPDFEIWVTGERERLEQLYLRMLSGLIETRRAEGNWPEVAALARRALVQDNLQESMHVVLIEALARHGERSEALRQYDAMQAILARELGVEPLPETKTLRAAILNGAFKPARRDSQGAQPGSINSSRNPYVGRKAELAVLDQELQAARAGHVRVALITGEVGIGKSRLWQEWAAALGADVTVLETHCLESTQALPFAPLTEMFSRPACIQRLFTAGSPIPRIWLAEIARLLPEIRVSMPDLPAPAVLPPEEEQRRVFEAFAQSLRALSDRPLVLFMDDMHWADRATLDWLGYFVDRLRGQALLLVLTYRPEDASAPLVHLIANWGRQNILRRIPLTRLTSAESAALVSSLGGDPALADTVQAQSAGNPYFLLELVRAEPGSVPPALTELIRARLDRLPNAAQQALQAAAVLDADFDFVALRLTSGRGEEELLDAVDALLNAAVLVEHNGRYSFVHPLVAAVVLHSLSSARGAFLHRRAAEALEVAHASHLAPVAGRLAAHYAQAGEPKKAAQYAEMAAEHALTLAAPSEALEFYQQALALDPTPERQLGLGNVQANWGDLHAARDAFRAALAGFEAQNDRRGMTRACLRLAETFIPSGRADEIALWVARGLTYLDASADPEAHALAHFLMGVGRLVSEQSFEEAEADLNEAARLATENSLLGMAARSRFELGNLRALRGDLPSAIQAFEQSITLAHRAGEQVQEVLGHNNAAYHALLAGDLRSAHEHWDAGYALTEAGGLRLPLQYLYSTRGEIALAEGQWDEAETWFKRGLAEAERNGNAKQAANYQANLGLAARGRGDLDGALMLLDAAREQAEVLIAPHLQTQIDLWLTELYFERGERAAADESLSRAEARLTDGTRRRLQEWAARLRNTQTAAP